MATENSDNPSLLGGTQPKMQQRSHELANCTVKAPLFSYAQLEMITNEPDTPDLDALQVKAYCSAALKQFLGVTGEAMSVDILKVQGNECWLRIPRQDLGPFAAAITAWPGTKSGSLMRLKACGDWLGSLLARAGQQSLWDLGDA